MKRVLILSLLLLAGKTFAQQKNTGVSALDPNAIVYDTAFKAPAKTVYNYVGHMPQFDEKKHGSLNSYLANHISLPASSVGEIPDTKVIVSFLIEENGAISEPKIVRSAGLVFDSIAVQLVRQMPPWIPSRNDAGAAISLRYTMPIRVCLQ